MRLCWISRSRTSTTSIVEPVLGRNDKSQHVQGRGRKILSETDIMGIDRIILGIDVPALEVSAGYW